MIITDRKRIAIGLLAAGGLALVLVAVIAAAGIGPLDGPVDISQVTARLEGGD